MGGRVQPDLQSSPVASRLKLGLCLKVGLTLDNNSILPFHNFFLGEHFPEMILVPIFSSAQVEQAVNWEAGREVGALCNLTCHWSLT